MLLYGLASSVCFEVSLHFFVPAKHLNHIELAVLVSVRVGAFTQQLIDLIKSFIIYLSPPFCHNIKKNIKKIQMSKTEHTEEEDDFIKVQPMGTKVQEETDQMHRNKTDAKKRKKQHRLNLRWP